MELWDKTFNFEDNIGLLVLKIIALKNNPYLWRNVSILTTWNGFMGQTFIFEDNMFGCWYLK